MSGLLILLAHPRLQHSRVSRAMAEAAKTVDRVVVHDLYELYPDCHIYVKREQELAASVNHLVLQFPLQWYSCPSLLKEWLDVVLEWGWAYGESEKALAGKTLTCAITIGGSARGYQPDGPHRYPLEDFLKPFEQTAEICGMIYKPPFVFYHSRKADEDAVRRHAQAYQHVLSDLLEGT